MIMLRIRGILAGFALGVLVGAAGLNIAVGNSMDKAELEIRKLNMQLEDQAQQLANMEKELALKGSPVVNDIDVHVDLPDEYEKLEIENRVKTILKNLRGQDVKTLDPVLVSSIVDNRIIETNEHKYDVKVAAVLISEKIILHLEAKEIPETLP